MAAPKKTDCQLADSADFPLIAAAQTLIADYSITYSTDDPGLSAADATVITDGDLNTFVIGEFTQALTDIAGKINAILDVLEAHGLMKAA